MLVMCEELLNVVVFIPPPFLYLSGTFYFRAGVWQTVPPIHRPSDQEFINYAKEGKAGQLEEALQHYPSLVNVTEEVSWDSHGNAWFVRWLVGSVIVALFRVEGLRLSGPVSKETSPV